MATVTERKTGWLMRWTTKDQSTGKLVKHGRMYDGQAGRRAALAEANRIEAAERAKSGGSAPKTLTLAGYIEDRWLPFVESSTSATTARTNRQRIGKVTADIGAMPLREVSGMVIDLMIARMKAEGVGPLMARHHFDVLRTALRQALKWKLIGEPVWMDASRPSVPKRRAKFATLEESFRLADALRTANHLIGAAYVETIADTGARPGEVLALMWDSVDIDAGVVRIWRALERVSGAEYRMKETPKNEGSVRTITLSSGTAATLRALKVHHAELHLRSGGAWPKDGLLFPGATGCIWPVHAAAALINKWAKRVGVTSGSYSRRHGMASEMLAGGVPVSVVAERMGHASTKMTLDVYGHVLPGHADAAVAFLNARNKA